MDHRTNAPADPPAEDQEPMRTSALFLLGAVSVLLIGMARTLAVQYLPVQLPGESSRLAMLRLQYALVGVATFSVFALFYRWLERDGNRHDRRLSRFVFWLTFLGFNVAFLPTSWRGLRPALITQPGGLLSGESGVLPLAGTLAFVAGCLVCLWTLFRPGRHDRRAAAWSAHE
jgi:cytochrome c oxidase subunit I+III